MYKFRLGTCVNKDFRKQYDDDNNKSKVSFFLPKETMYSYSELNVTILYIAPAKNFF